MLPQDVVVALKVENTISGWLSSGKLTALKRDNIHEQKRMKNRGELDRVIVEGRHQPIVTKEEFKQVQKLIAEKSRQMEKCRTNRGVYADDLWRKKMRCQCGHAFAKTRWHSKKNFTTYIYKCYDQTRTGTVPARLKNGLSIEGVCPVPLVQDWKMHSMGQKVLHAIFDDPEATLREAAAVLGGGAGGSAAGQIHCGGADEKGKGAL